MHPVSGGMSFFGSFLFLSSTEDRFAGNRAQKFVLLVYRSSCASLVALLLKVSCPRSWTSYAHA